VGRRGVSAATTTVLTLSVNRSQGRMADVTAGMRDVPARLFPYAASTAMTRVAKQVAAKDLPAAMQRVFQQPTRWTLNSLAITPATKDTLTARVFVKDSAASGGVAQEKYLLPEVDGGERRQKRFERALRFQGLITGGQFVVPTLGAELDASGNVRGATARQVLNALKRVRAASDGRDRKTGKRLRKGRVLKNDLFLGTPSEGFGERRKPRSGASMGIYRREGKRLRMLFLVTNRRPTYRQRLDFEGTVAAVVRERFEPEFRRAVAEMEARRS